MSDSCTMKPKYRAEVFIVPKSVIVKNELCYSNEIDDVKAANKLKLVNLESNEPDERTPSVPDEKIDDDREFVPSYVPNDDFVEPIYDVPCSVRTTKTERPNGKLNGCETAGPPKISLKRSSSLTSIDERGENDGILEEFCFHGYKNGCTAAAQRPEDVSEDVFKENWLRRLESLRERESVLRDKETLMQERERLLFKKERELRILERLVKDKLKQADLYLKRCKSSQSIESGSNCDVKTRSSEGSRDSNSRRKTDERIFNPAESKLVERSRCVRDEPKSFGHRITEVGRSASSLGSGTGCEDGTMKNPPNSASSLATATGINVKPTFVKSHSQITTLPMRNSFAVPSGYSSLRCKPKPKINYDDLDSTLSADIGDSSYVVTSGKFDPEIFKKPFAFTRSSSERRTRNDQETNFSHNYESTKQGIRGNPTDEKVLKRLSDNIIISQDKTTKFLDYGIIDPGLTVNDADNARQSYLNLERSNDSPRATLTRRISKERPISWNEETNEWLQKKRQAYNLANKRMPNERFENKENSDKAVKRDKSDKSVKKKDSKIKKFAIFR